MKRLTDKEFEKIKMKILSRTEFEEWKKTEVEKMGFTVKMNEYLNPERWI